MNKIALIIIALTALSSARGALDSPIVVTDYDSIFSELVRLREVLSSNEASDLASAVQEIERVSEVQTLPDLEKSRRARFFVLMIRNRTPREIILTGAALMLARAGRNVDLLNDEGSRDGNLIEKRKSEFLVSKAAALIECYSRPEGSIREQTKGSNANGT